MTAAAHAESAVVSQVQGDAKIIRNGETLKVTAGLACQNNDTLKTGENCVVDISMNSLVGCRILPASECAVMDENVSGMNLKVKSGNVILNLEKLPSNSSFALETPTAIASVRGTQFWGRVDLQKINNPVTTFAVRQGSVEVFAKSVQKSFTLNQGQALDIHKDAAAAPTVRSALAEEMNAMKQAPSIKTSVE
jgi:hypothetical protein